MNETGKPIMQFHFENRLFDRDTLFVQSYNINFLFVLSAIFIRENSTLKNKFKKDTQKIFREKFVAFINEKYQFYKVKPNEEYFLDKHFKLLNGKVYKPSQLEDELILAFEKGSDIDSIILEIEAELERKNRLHTNINQTLLVAHLQLAQTNRTKPKLQRGQADAQQND